MLRRLRATARRADADLVRMARGQGALDLALGETLLRLFDGDRLGALGIARKNDYARERLGLPPRTMYVVLRLARETRDRPLLRRAVLCGAVTPNAAVLVAPLARGDAEAYWVGQAMSLPLSELAERVKAGGAPPAEAEFEAESLVLAMTAEEQMVYEEALRAAREIVGLGSPRWQQQEAVADEWLGGHGEWDPPEADSGAAARGADPAKTAPAADPALWARAREGVERQLRVLEEAHRAIELGDADLCTSAKALDARARRLSRARQTLDEPFGRLLLAFHDAAMWWWLSYRSFAEYARERLGLSPRTVRERIWLSRRLLRLPDLAEALRSGRLSLAQAILIARQATETDVAERIAAAAARPCAELEEEVTAEEQRRDLAHGVRRIWGPKEVMETVRRSILSAQAWSEAEQKPIAPGQALALTGVYFLAVWDEHRKRHRRRPLRRAVFARTDGICCVPGCTNGADHEHHIKYRSHGGSDEIVNRIAVCAHCHRAIHAGLIRVHGRADGKVVFEFRCFEEPETWEWTEEGGSRRVPADEEAAAQRRVPVEEETAGRRQVPAGEEGAAPRQVPADEETAARQPPARREAGSRWRAPTRRKTGSRRVPSGPETGSRRRVPAGPEAAAPPAHAGEVRRNTAPAARSRRRTANVGPE